MLSSCRKRNKSSYHSKPVDYYRRRHQQQSCFRNPIVVFTICFLALGSLRFRVRTKKAAQNLIQRGRQRISGRSGSQRDADVTLPSVTTGGRTIAYELMEGNALDQPIEKSAKTDKLQRYRAVWVENNARGEMATKGPVSVDDWIQYMLQNESDSSPNSLLDQFIQILQSGNSYPAYFFETKGVTAANARTKTFEFVLVDAPQLQTFVRSQQGNSNEDYFANQFQDASCAPMSWSCAFPNLGKDAILVAPKPAQAIQNAPPNMEESNTKKSKKNQSLAHLASFVRHGQYSQVRDFWLLVLRTYRDRLALSAPKDSRAETERQLNNTTLSKNLQLRQATPVDSKAPVWLSTSGLGVAWVHVRLDSQPKYYTYAPFAQEH